MPVKCQGKQLYVKGAVIIMFRGINRWICDNIISVFSIVSDIKSRPVFCTNKEISGP